MATKRKAEKKPTAMVKDPNILRIIPDDGASNETANAMIAYDPAARSLAGARLYIKGSMGEQALTESLEALNTQIKEVQAGNLGSAEKTLVAQANTLDAIFNELARRAALNMGEHLSAAETYLRLALKAQGQCRATLETLAEIKNPMAGAYVRQANIAAGHQQINNGTPPTGEASRAREFEIEQSKQSGGDNELLPDTRASALAGRVDPRMEAVG